MRLLPSRRLRPIQGRERRRGRLARARYREVRQGCWQGHRHRSTGSPFSHRPRPSARRWAISRGGHAASRQGEGLEPLEHGERFAAVLPGADESRQFRLMVAQALGFFSAKHAPWSLDNEPIAPRPRGWRRGLRGYESGSRQSQLEPLPVARISTISAHPWVFICHKATVVLSVGETAVFEGATRIFCGGLRIAVFSHSPLGCGVVAV